MLRVDCQIIHDVYEEYTYLRDNFEELGYVAISYFVVNSINLHQNLVSHLY